MRKCIRADGVPLTSSEKSKRYREKKKQEQKEQEEMLRAFLNGTEYDYIKEWIEKNLINRV